MDRTQQSNVLCRSISCDQNKVCLSSIRIKEVVCFGEGAGANIMARFAVSCRKSLLTSVTLFILPFNARQGIDSFFRFDWSCYIIILSHSLLFIM